MCLCVPAFVLHDCRLSHFAAIAQGCSPVLHQMFCSECDIIVRRGTPHLVAGLLARGAVVPGIPEQCAAAC